MPKKFRPITPSMRQLVLPEHAQLTRAKEGCRKKVKPTKALLAPKNEKQAVITMVVSHVVTAVVDTSKNTALLTSSVKKIIYLLK